MEMREGKLYATKTINARLKSIISPDQKIQFLYETESLYAKQKYPMESCDFMIKDYGAMLEAPEWGIPAEDTETTMYGIKKLYYLPKEYIGYKFNYDDPETGAQQTKELESKSILLWDGAEEGTTQQERPSGNRPSVQEEQIVQQSEDIKAATSETEDENKVGQGFNPPKGSHIDKKGNIVDKEGNTFNKKGEWQVPEGGYIDSQGRIIDKNGRIMGGGAKVGSVG